MDKVMAVAQGDKLWKTATERPAGIPVQLALVAVEIECEEVDGAERSQRAPTSASVKSNNQGGGNSRTKNPRRRN